MWDVYSSSVCSPHVYNERYTPRSPYTLPLSSSPHSFEVSNDAYVVERYVSGTVSNLCWHQALHLSSIRVFVFHLESRQRAYTLIAKHRHISKGESSHA